MTDLHKAVAKVVEEAWLAGMSHTAEILIKAAKSDTRDNTSLRQHYHDSNHAQRWIQVYTDDILAILKWAEENDD